MGRPIIIEFSAAPPVKNEKTRVSEIKYDFRSYGDEITMIRSGNENDYCMKQCLKMCYYIQKMHNIEVVKMRCHFAKDDNGSIWFIFATNIFTREILGSKQAAVSAKVVKYINKEHQKLLVDQLKDHRDK